MAKTTYPRCSTCGFHASGYPGESCKNRDWHKDKSLSGKPAALEWSRNGKRQVGVALVGEVIARLYVMAYNENKSLAEKAGELLTEAINPSTRLYHVVQSGAETPGVFVGKGGACFVDSQALWTAFKLTEACKMITNLNSRGHNVTLKEAE